MNHKIARMEYLGDKVMVVLKRGYSWSRKAEENTRFFVNKQAALDGLKGVRRYKGPEPSE
jgi:hypothetical protein